MKLMRVELRSLFLVLAAGVVSVSAASAQDRVTYKVLATSKTSTMEKEMGEAGGQGYHFVAVMGGDTAGGGKEVVVLMERRNDDATKYDYRLLATNKTSTLQRELQDAADAGFVAVGQTVFESLFGGKETAAILERNPSRPRDSRFEFKLIATSKTSTLEKELQEAAAAGYQAIAMTVGQTAFGGAELVVITRRPAR